MPVGVTVGTEGVIVDVIWLGDVDGFGTNVLVEYAIASGVVGFSTHPVGNGMVTIKPVGSTVGETAGSFDVTVKVVPAGYCAPNGESVPVKIRVFPPTVGSMVISLNEMAVGVDGRIWCSMRRRT